MARIAQIRAREILDSRGNPTVEVDLRLDSGVLGRAAVPSGASTGSREALELRDGGDRYGGKGVRQAIQNVDGEIAKAVVGTEIGGLEEQEALDRALCERDGTETKARLGANAILGVSLAASHAAAADAGLPLYRWIAGDGEVLLPLPMMNVLNGGAHAANAVDFQEFMILPTGASSFSEAVRYGTEVFHSLRKVLTERKLSTAVGDEGGFAPDLRSNREALETVLRGIERAGYRPGEDLCVGLDVAASEFHREGQYRLEGEGKTLGTEELIRLYADWVERYPLVTLEDGLGESDWEGWKTLTDALGSRIQIVGDDIFVTNPQILRKGIERGVSNSILIKLNQIGTVTETLQTMRLADRVRRRIPP
jgi:enolase